MNIILQQRLVNGFSNISDPCVLGSPPAACTILTTFASTQGLAVSSAIVASGSDVKTATVTVTGTGNAQVVMRFVQ